jgi:uncharacterized protein YdaU (DUF1376 family)
MALPFMPFYWGDYWRDTAHLSDAEHVSYLRLISHYWQHGSLPTDDARLARIAGRSMVDWMQIRPVISEFFQIDWRHKRIDRDLDKQGAAHEARVMGGKMTAAKRWANSSATSSAYSNQNQNQNHIHNQNKEPKKKSFARGSRLPEDWLPRVEDGNDPTELVKFRDYWKGAPGQKGVKLDWDATWRNWLRTAGKGNLISAKPKPKTKGLHEMTPEERESRLAEIRREQENELRTKGA